MSRTRRRGKIALVILLVVTLAVVLEIGAYGLMVVKGKNFYLPLDLNDLSAATIPAEVKASFDKDLGWEPDQPAFEGYRGEPKPGSDAAIALFGDDYTQGPADFAASWPFLLEQSLQRPVLNFGVAGYGIDQAYLRFKKRFAGEAETPYVALVMMSGGISRIASRYRGFYIRQRDVRFTKPMFQPTETGIKLLPNPLSSVEEVPRLGDLAFLQEIGKDDYWFQYFDQYGLNRFATFPYSYRLLKAAPYYLYRWRAYRLSNDQSYQALYGQEDAQEVMHHIIKGFIAEATAKGSLPIFVMLPTYPDMAKHLSSGKTSYDMFLKGLPSALDHPYVYDGLAFFSKAIAAGEGLHSIFASREADVYSAKGERLVARGMYELLTALEQQRPAADRHAAGRRR